MTKEFLQKLEEEGSFDNVLLILMSDHGARFANRYMKGGGEREREREREREEKKRNLVINNNSDLA